MPILDHPRRIYKRQSSSHGSDPGPPSSPCAVSDCSRRSGSADGGLWTQLWLEIEMPELGAGVVVRIPVCWWHHSNA